MLAADDAENRRTWSAPEVCALVGCTYRQLDYWIRAGRIPLARAARGSGTQRRLGREGIDAARVLTRVARLTSEADTLSRFMVARALAHRMLGGEAMVSLGHGFYANLDELLAD